MTRVSGADARGKAWRWWLGVGALLLAIALPVGALLLSSFGFPITQSPLIAFLLVGGMPEILCLLAIAVLGRDHFGSVVQPLERTRLLAPRSDSVSRTRYYAGLIGCLLNGVPLSLYAYAPGLMPGGTNRYFILASADLVFVYCVFLAGGEFWEKFRRLFVWEGLPERVPRGD